jgi:hypothetical protein
MKQKDDWRNKLDASGLQFLEGYRKSIDALRNVTDSAKAHEKLEEIAAQHPQIRVLGTVEVLPQFLDRLRQSEQLADVLAELQPTPGTKTMPSPAARVVDVMQVVTLALDDPQMRVAAGSVAGLAALILGNIYEDISNKYYGDAGPTKTEDLMWTVGTTLEVLGKILKSGKAPEMKGKVNVELLQLIKMLRKHEKVKLTYRELREALAYLLDPTTRDCYRKFA